MATKVTDHYFEYGTLKYFRGNAHLVDICTYGEKKDPIGAEAYLDPQNIIKRDYLVNKITKGLSVGIDWAGTSAAQVEVNGQVKVFKLGVSASVGMSYSSIKSANMKLYNLSISEGPLKSLLNNEASGARNFLATEGSDGRTVSEVWVVMEATLAAHFDSSTSIAVTVPAVGLNITAKGGSSGTQTITLSAGSVFAYKMHKVKDWNSDKTVINDLEADYYGNG